MKCYSIVPQEPAKWQTRKDIYKSCQILVINNSTATQFCQTMLRIMFTKIIFFNNRVPFSRPLLSGDIVT